jgi:hypothetical protein
MYKYFSALIIIFCIIIITGCGTKKTDNPPTSDTSKKKTQEQVKEPVKTGSSFKFTNKELVKSYKNCVPESDSCSYIRLRYIEAADGKAKDKINSLIQKELLFAYEMPDHQYKNPGEMMDGFLSDYESASKQLPKFRMDWAIDANIEAYTETDYIVCISYDIYSFTGGAHPNSFTVFFNFNKETGDTISLANIFKHGFEPKLNALIDKKFREMNDLKPGDNLVDKGGLFENYIKFNYNFAITRDSVTNAKGVEFIYNPYEIASYAAGPVELVFTRAELEVILAPNNLLK